MTPSAVGGPPYGAAMTDTDLPPWEPPFTADEREQWLGHLGRLRTTFRWKTDGLDAAGLRTRLGTSWLTLGSLLKHLASVEDDVFTRRLTGEPVGAPWDSAPAGEEGSWPFTSSWDDSPEELYGLYDAAVARSTERLRAFLGDGGLDTPVALTGPDGTPATTRRLLGDLVEEYGRHTGHADLIRESVDGLVGEDPPEDWRPANGGEPWGR